MFSRLIAIAATACAVIASSHAQEYPQSEFSSDIPKLVDVVGHDHGEDISSIADIQTYLKALAEAAPDRMQLNKYAETWQGRDLVYAVISSPENMAKLPQIRDTMDRLASGQPNGIELDMLANNIPAVVWLSYGVHGNEITPPDSALYLAYFLLAAENNALVDQILENTVVIIDPSQNPDGRDRFVNAFRSSIGLEADADGFTAEHDEPWPRGRVNHYMFDLNRDWFALTQPETRGKVAAVIDWHPIIYVDSHEMSGDSTYYFPPPAKPFNPDITSGQRARQIEIGKNLASWFDRFGVSYFTREVYDAFYPGYGDMWPTLNGAIAMTFEQASPRGLKYARKDGTTLTYGDGVRNNVLTSLATLEIVAQNKLRYLKDYTNYRSEAITKGRSLKDRIVVLDLATRRYEAETLARRLLMQSIGVRRAPPGATVCGQTYPKGALMVDLLQPQGILAGSLLRKSTPLAPEFIEEQESRRDRDLYHELYDVTAWSLPLMDGVGVNYCASFKGPQLPPVNGDDPIPAMPGDVGDFGYVVPWTDGGQARLVIAALKEGLVAKTTDEPFTQNGRVYPSGSVVFPAKQNDADLHQRLTALAIEIGAEFVPMASSWVEDGPNFGSDSFAALKMPKVAIAWGEGTSSGSAGNTRFVLERQLGIPVAAIRVSTMAYADLSKYDVIILPETGRNFDKELGSYSALQTFVRKGGVLVSIGSAVATLSGEDAGLLSTKLEYAADEVAEDKNADKGDESRAKGVIFETEDEYETHIHDHRASPEDIPGVLVKAVANTDHWLSAGYTEATALVTGRSIYRPLNKGDGVNVFRFAGADDLLESGYLWEENRKQLAYKPFVMAERQGSGVVIGFTQSPTTRAYLDGLNLLLANAVVLGPARMGQ